MSDLMRPGGALNVPADGAYDLPLPAGQELDAVIAEKVMGWTEYDRAYGDATCRWFTPSAFDPVNNVRRQIPAFSTDVAAAWLVVEHLQRTRNLSFALGLNACANGHQNGAKFFEGFRGLGHDIFDNAHHEGWHVVDETVPLAIARAALAATAP